MTKDEDDLHEVPEIIEKLFGEDYNGPLSTFAEWHALEYGAIAGFALALLVVVPMAAPVVVGLYGVARRGRLVSGEMRRQIFHEKHYFGVGSIALFFLTLGAATVAPSVGL